MVDWTSFAAGIITTPLLIYFVLSVVDACGYRIRLVGKLTVDLPKSAEN